MVLSETEIPKDKKTRKRLRTLRRKSNKEELNWIILRIQNFCPQTKKGQWELLSEEYVRWNWKISMCTALLIWLYHLFITRESRIQWPWKRNQWKASRHSILYTLQTLRVCFHLSIFLFLSFSEVFSFGRVVCSLSLTLDLALSIVEIVTPLNFLNNVIKKNSMERQNRQVGRNWTRTLAYVLCLYGVFVFGFWTLLAAANYF